MVENQLIEKCKKGDGDAFRLLVNNYRNKLFGYLYKFSNSQDMAEEMFQETLIKIWQGLKKYNTQKRFSSWLFTIAHNVAMDSLRKRKSNNSIVSIEELEDKSSSVKPDEDIIKNETIGIINNSLKNLSEKQRIVFLLRQHGELTFKEIAKTTKEPLNTVISHMHYAIKKIKKLIEYENEPRKKTII